MSQPRHDAAVIAQFDPQAAAYVASPVHAGGPDLDLIDQIVESNPDAVALDLGSGGGHLTFRLAARVGKVVAYDLSPSMLEAVRAEAARRGLSNIVAKQGSAEALTCPDHSFHIVSTRYSAHHWRDIGAGLDQMRRVLKPGGLGLFMDVVTSDDPLLDTWLQSLELLRDPSHVRNYSISQWREMLSARGFEVRRVESFRVRLDFKSWIERMNTPPAHATAIRSLQQRCNSEVGDAFGLEDDGSFTLDSVLIVAEG